MSTSIIYDQGSSKDMIPFVGLFADKEEVRKKLLEICELDSALDTTAKIPAVNNPTFVFISGNSRFEDSKYLKKFYNDLLELIKDQWVKADQNLILVVILEYFNSGSGKTIGDLFTELNNFFGNRFHIVWLADDENYVGAGEDYKEILEKESFLIEEVIIKPKKK
ncbi:TPA: DUF1987 domain-containing protein [Patescibacteria group bacterium]|nr:hypothetical protein P148_SR1C00001G0078 [candidate division SR1 bacterium RAAC1_SR1_1]HCY21446.1 DUF1987 domain-containing protein [Candidatus Gracilibacteria bacterium]